VFFDTLASSRKAVNLRHNPAAALVIGRAAAGSERTVQLEGVADEPKGSDLERLLELYARPSSTQGCRVFNGNAGAGLH
jgi:Pyridoxamine 5'-phosphate oxidase